MKLCVIGTGYVGLVAGTCFAESGNDVICVDNVAAKIETLRGGVVPIYEPGLEELVRRNVAEARLTFSTDLADAVRKSVVCFIAVGTPSGGDGAADLSAVMEVARGIGRAMDGYRVVVAKSTVPVLVDFTATWCGPCKMLAPVIEELAGEYQGRVKVGKLDIDDNQATAQKFQIRGVPTVLLFQNGRVVDQMVGVAPKAKFQNMLARILGA